MGYPKTAVQPERIQVIVQPAKRLLNPLVKVHQRLVLADLDRARHSLEVLESSIETQDRRHGETLTPRGVIRLV